MTAATLHPRARQVTAALRSLPSYLRAAVVAHRLEGRPVWLVAQGLGLSTATAYAQISEGLDRLAEQGVTLPNDEAAAVDRAVEVLRATYGDTAPAGLPGVDALRKTHLWSRSRTDAARAIYVGGQR